MERLPSLVQETSMLDGARLFVASYPLRDGQVAHVWRNAFYTLMWLQGGLATLICDGERFEVAPLSLVCVAPGQVYWWDGPQPDTRVVQLGFLPDIFTAGVLDVQLLTDLPLFRPDGTTILATRDAASSAIDVLFAQVWTRYLESADQQASRRWRVLPAHREGLLLAYLHAILAEATTLDLAESRLRPAQTADLRLSRLFRFHAAQSALQRLPVAHYAQLLHVTPAHLSRTVQRVTGRPPSAWLHERLLLEAKRRLIFTDQPVEVLAAELNFTSATQFSQWFHARTGETPRQTRQGHIKDSTVPVRD
jgi:AraC family transcriptional activator of pobA